MPSSSNLSKTVPHLWKITYFRCNMISVGLKHDSRCYTLEDVATYCNVKIDENMKNEDLACKCIQIWCNAEPRTSGLSVFPRRMIPQLQNLPTLVSSSREVADTIVLSKNEKEFVLMFKVHSSPIRDTLNKAVIEAANILRLLRAAGSNSVNKISVFTLPKRNYKWCITEVEVIWENFQFQYRYVAFEDIHNGIVRIKQVMQEQRHIIPDTSIHRFLITLTVDEQKKLADWGGSQVAREDVKQLNSGRHIMVTDGEYVYKLLYEPYEVNGYRFYTNKCTKEPSSPLLVEHELLMNHTNITLCKYRYFRHGPLNVTEACDCLRQFVMELKKALDALHSIGLSHNDIRLPNICFNDEFKPVFVDFDMCESVTELHPLFGDPPSCMYELPNDESINFNGIKTDYLQVGWLVAYILLHGEGSYHNRNWNDVKKRIPEYTFVHKLVEECEYDTKEVEQLPCKKSLDSILQERL